MRRVSITGYSVSDSQHGACQRPSTMSAITGETLLVLHVNMVLV